MSTANEPNEYGFGGGSTAPQPQDEPGDDRAERTAVPDDDLTDAVADKLRDVSQRDTDEERR